MGEKCQGSILWRGETWMSRDRLVMWGHSLDVDSKIHVKGSASIMTLWGWGLYKAGIVVGLQVTGGMSSRTVGPSVFLSQFTVCLSGHEENSCAPPHAPAKTCYIIAKVKTWSLQGCKPKWTFSLCKLISLDICCSNRKLAHTNEGDRNNVRQDIQRN